MRTVRRLGKDESGMTLGLAMVMVVLIGVMGAGLLTFVSTDLYTVLEVNRGQRAFEVAEAGVGVAKRQLTEDCAAATLTAPCQDHYDDDPVAGVIGLADSSQWSAVNGGVTLNDLDGDGDPKDNVLVTIKYLYPAGVYKVVSTGNYGVAKRKIEATFKGVSGGGGGSGLGHPIYYTPSSVKIEGATGTIALKSISMISTRDILIEGVLTRSAFIADYDGASGGSFHVPNTPDDLQDWNSTIYPAATRGFWNTVGRKGNPGVQQCKQSNQACKLPGFAAQGKICGFPIGTDPGGVCGSNPIISDGVYSYDSTTGDRLAPLDAVTGYPEVCPTAADPANPRPLAERGNNLTFCAKDPPQKNPNDAGTIAYPFPRPTPNELNLRGFAQTQNPSRYYEGCTPPWDTLTNGATDETVIFIDAGDCPDPINFSTSNSANNKGILVVWCGDLQLNAKFQGIILNLWGDNLPGGSTCGPERGIFRNNGQDFSGWLYAEGGTATKAGIELGPNSSISFLPGGDWSFFNDFFSGGPPTSFQTRGWRELYQ